MDLTIYNSLTRRKERFVPRVPGQVGMYLCGPTVYNRFHIGNARTFVLGDTMRRILEYLGYKVTYVQNFTDVEDKIIKRAKEVGISTELLVEREIANYFADADKLGIKRADVHPRVTEHIENIIDYIKLLMEHGYAYQVGGDVYFTVQKYKPYGQLSNQKLDDLVLGSRVEVGEGKHFAADFALWKAAKPEEVAWESPWGLGRPGWHIECSVMVRSILGGHIDIHAGGMDLMFPHHENERAQSEVLSEDEPYVKYWVHIAFLVINNAKMSKSLGNFHTAADLLEKYDGKLLRFFLQGAHYRKPLSFDLDLIDSAASALGRLENAIVALEQAKGLPSLLDAPRLDVAGYEQKFREAVADDFNTAEAWAVIFDVAKEANVALGRQELAGEEAAKVQALMVRLADILGVGLTIDNLLEEHVHVLIAKRQAAREAKDYKSADLYRAELAAMGVVIEDTPQGVRWKKQ